MVNVISKKKSSLIAVAAVALLGLSSCAASAGGAGEMQAEVGEPVYGGTLKFIEAMPITGFDPVQAYSSTSTPATYSALYGDFLKPNPETGIAECNMCETFESTDGGDTYTVTLKDGIEFTDSTPFDAEAVKYNWDRVKVPENGSASLGYASQIESIDVVDDLTLTLNMAATNPGFLGNFQIYALQWIASPTALEQGTEAFNANPIGAGPFTLESWTPNGVAKFVKNEAYYDAPKPYLDAIEVQGVTDSTQRLNALLTGDADAILNSDAFVAEDATAAGFVLHDYKFNGGTALMFNHAQAPFDDVRARQALMYALDVEALSDAATGGYPSVPKTLFNEDSPYYADIPLSTYDPEKAQELFDELAAEGKPLDFEFAMTPGPAAEGTFNSLQAQLQQYDNVTVTADQKPASEAGVFITTGEFQLTTSSLAFSDPSGRLWGSLHSQAGATNYSRYDDAKTDAALDAAGATDDEVEKAEQYLIVQEQYVENVPYILYNSYHNQLLTTDQVQGVLMHGYVTPRIDDIWLMP